MFCVKITHLQYFSNSAIASWPGFGFASKIFARRSVYHSQTKPLVDFYTKLSNSATNVRVIKVNGLAKVDAIREEIFKTL